MRDSHAAVLRKFEDGWYIFDSAEEFPINFSEERERAKQYFARVDFVNCYVFEEDWFAVDEEDEEAERWMRILGYGEGIPKRSKDRRKRVRGERKRSDNLAHSHNSAKRHEKRQSSKKTLKRL